MLEMSCSQTTGAHMFCKVNSTIMFLSLYMLGHNALEITVFTLYFILNASIYYLPSGGVMIKTGKHNIHAALMELNVRNVL